MTLLLKSSPQGLGHRERVDSRQSGARPNGFLIDQRGRQSIDQFVETGDRDGRSVAQAGVAEALYDF
ncbi:hypothetical protein ACWCQW_46530 [Streptomyces mirabilis]